MYRKQNAPTAGVCVSGWTLGAVKHHGSLDVIAKRVHALLSLAADRCLSIYACLLKLPHLSRTRQPKMGKLSDQATLIHAGGGHLQQGPDPMTYTDLTP